MIGIFTLIVLYSIFFHKQHSVKIPLHLQSPFKKVTRRDNTCTFKPEGFRVKNYRREFFARKNAPVSPSELRQRLGLSKRSDLRRIVQQVKNPLR